MSSVVSFSFSLLLGQKGPLPERGVPGQGEKTGGHTLPAREGGGQWGCSENNPAETDIPHALLLEDAFIQGLWQRLGQW